MSYTIEDTEVDDVKSIDGWRCRRHTNPNGSLGGWVSEMAKVADTVHLGPNALVLGYAEVTGRVRIYGRVLITDFANVSEDAYLNNKAEVSGYACVSGKAQLRDYARAMNGSIVTDSASLFGNAILKDRVIAKENTSVVNGTYGQRQVLNGAGFHYRHQCDIDSEMARIDNLRRVQ